MSQVYADFAKIFKAISDETRLKIIDMLSWGELCASEILEEFKISQSTLSYHMKILTDSGLVNGVRDGVWMRYSLNQDRAKAVLAFYSHIITPKKGHITQNSGY